MRKGSRRPSNLLALAVLAQLQERPMHPYEIAAQMRHRGLHAVIRLNYGSLYAIVEGLARDGLIAAEAREKDGRRPERQTYALTDAGRTTFRAWLAQIVREPAKEYPAFAAGIAMIGALPPGEATGLLAEREAALGQEIARLDADIKVATGHGIPRLFLLETEYARVLREAERAWIARVLGAIRDGSLEGIAAWLKFHRAAKRVARQGA